MNQECAGVGVISVNLVKYNHTVRQSPQPHKIVPHRKNSQQSLIYSTYSIFRKKCSFFMGKPFASMNLIRPVWIVNRGKSQMLEGIVQERCAMQELQVKSSLRF